MDITLSAYLDNLKEYKKILEEIYNVQSNIDNRKELIALREKESSVDFWAEPDEAQKVTKRINEIQSNENKIKELTSNVEDLIELIQILKDEEHHTEIEKEIKALGKEIEQLTTRTLLSQKYDGCNAILTLHAGAGGTEAQDWCEMLYRMYKRFAERHAWKVTELDYLAGDGAGIKSVSFKVSGQYVYGYLKCEKGVHRLVRISPFDSGKRRHTSFASLEVMPELEDDSEISIRPEDLKVDTFRSSGAGGQHVNKTESAVRITHIPTGIVVACQNERSQIQNRETAMTMLRSKLLELKVRQKEEENAKISGELKKIEWGSQIRSYVFCPYTMVKDHRTNWENSDVQAVMDGDLDEYITAYLKALKA